MGSAFSVFSFIYLFLFWSSKIFYFYSPFQLSANGHIHKVVSTLINVVKLDVENNNVVHINVEIDNVDSTLFNNVNFNDSLSTRILIVTFYEIAIKYESELKTQQVLLDISTNQAKINWKSFECVFSYILLKANLMKLILKMHLKNSTRLGFRWLMKSTETIKLYNRSFCRCYSLFFLYFYDTTLFDVGTSHPPNNNVETTLECLLGRT